MMIAMLHLASRGGHASPCQVQGEDGPLQSRGRETEREVLDSGDTVVMRESGGETEIEVETEIGM